MKKTVRIWLIAAACLILSGGAGFSLAMAANHWDFKALGDDTMRTSTFELREDFRDISIRSDRSKILFAPSDDGTSKVICYEAEREGHTVSVQNGTLFIERMDARKWYERITLFSFDPPTITVYLPHRQYASLSVEESTGDITIPKDFLFERMELGLSTGDVECRAGTSGLLRIKSDTGDLYLEGLSAGELDLSVSTGKVDVASVTCEGRVGVTVSTGKAKLTDVSCGSVRSDGDTGDISLKNVIAAETIAISRTTGDVSFERCDAAGLVIKTDTGKVTGSLRSDKVFITETDTGTVKVPKTVRGGRCEVKTNTGDIILEVIENGS